MISKTKIRIVVDEDQAIVAQIDAIAEAEGLARADVLRRAIRRLIFSTPNVLTSDKLSHENQPADVAA